MAIIGVPCRNYAHGTVHRSCILIYVMPIVRLLSFLFFNYFGQNTKICVAIESGFTVTNHFAGVRV